jgi:hypothetical protein
MKINNFNKCTLILSSLIMTLGFVPSLAASQAMDLNGLNGNYVEQEGLTFTPVGGGSPSTQTDYVGAVTGTLGGGATEFFFCYDLSNLINAPGNYQVNPTAPTASFPSYLGLQLNSFNLKVTSTLLNSLNLSSFTKADQFAGLQLAIWSVLYNWTSSAQSMTLNGSNFSTTASGDALADANAFLATAYSIAQSGQFNTGNWEVLVNANDSPGNVIQTLGGMVTPEPGTYLLLGSFLLMGSYSYKRKSGINTVQAE